MIEIKITGTTPLEALASVTAFGMHCMKNQDVHAAATRVLETEEGKVSKSDTAPAPAFGLSQNDAGFLAGTYEAHVKKNHPVPPVAAAPAVPAAPVAPVNPTSASVPPVNPAPTPAVVAPVAGPQVTPPGNAPAVAPVAAAPTYTMEQIGKAGADLVSQDAAKMPELLALLQKYGVQAITQLKPEQLGAFATELRGLGAKL